MRMEAHWCHWNAALFLLALLLIVQVGVVSSLTPALSKMKVDNSASRHPMVDDSGRVRVFHGLNRVEKGYPWYPSSMLNKTHIDILHSWGFNVVRLGMMWSGVEIGPYKVNETYLEIMEGIVQSLNAHGMYVIFDMHQDVLSSKFDSYDGAPLWLINSFPPSKHPFPSPFSGTPSPWGMKYLTYACGDAFEDLYNNVSGALDHLSFFWQTVAKRFGHYKNVLGYEIINEPFPGDVIEDPLLFIPGNPGSKYLQPMYDKVFTAINKVDTETLVFYEPVTWGMILHGRFLGTGFSHVPGGDNFKDRGVLSFHYYCWFAGTYSDNPFPWWLRKLCDNLFFPDVLSTVSEDIKDTGGAYFLTEFGLCRGSAPHNSTQYQECLSVLNTADPNFLSWTYWDSEFFGPGGSVNTGTAKLFSRPYAQAVSGIPKAQSFNADKSIYTLEYTSNPKLSAPTVIFVSPLHYPSGFKVNTGAQYNITDKQYVEVYHSNKAQQITITITAN